MGNVLDNVSKPVGPKPVRKDKPKQDDLDDNGEYGLDWCDAGEDDNIPQSQKQAEQIV